MAGEILRRPFAGGLRTAWFYFHSFTSLLRFDSSGRMPEGWRVVLLKLVTKSCIVKVGRSVDDTHRETDGCSLELATLWIERKLWGANGHG